MFWTGRHRILAGLMAGALSSAAAPSLAFELFGITLWGDREEDDGKIEIIDPLPYTVMVQVGGDDDKLEKTVEKASALWRGREEPASGKSGLLARSKGDYRRILAALYEAGYYGGEISITAAGTEVSELTLSVEFPASVPVVIRVSPGPEFLFGETGFVNGPNFEQIEGDEVKGPASVGFEAGEPARSKVVSAASDLAVDQWRQFGHAKAREAEREVIADHATSKLDVTLRLDPGRVAHYGRLRVHGSQKVDTRFIEFMLDLPEGKEFDPDDLRDAQDRLSRLGVFNAVRIHEADEIAPDGSLALDVSVEDRKPRTIGFGGTLSTIDGIGIEAYWQHRNLFGRAERLRFTATMEGLGKSADPDDYSYNLGVSFTKPGIYTPDTDFVTALVASRVDWDTYRETSVSTVAGVSQRFGEHLTGDLMLQAKRSRFDDDFGVRHFTTFGLIARGEYDRRRVDPLNATEGYWIGADIQPFYEAVYNNTSIHASLEGRVYHALDEDERFVLAGRAKYGTFLGASTAESPPDMLYFAGGGGSVRGYAFRSIGVEITDKNGDSGIAGGRGLFEASGELRVRLNQSFGVVGFVDTGLVTEDPHLSGNTEFRTGVGIGVRYYTGIGALRADLATPIDRRDEDSILALYIGIGQSF